MDTLEKILLLLSQQNKKQKDLTDYLKIGKQTTTEWKSGRNKSYMKYIPQIAEFFGTTPNYLLGEDEGSNVSEEEIKFALFDGSEDVTDEMFEEVKAYAHFVKERKRNGNK